MKYLIKNKAWDIVEDYNLDKILYLLADKPDYDTDNCIEWGIARNTHRNYDLPTIVYSDGYVCWWENNKIHRERSKPAIIKNTGVKEYWLNDKCIKEK